MLQCYGRIFLLPALASYGIVPATCPGFNSGIATLQLQSMLHQYFYNL